MTALLERVREGRTGAADDLFALLYDDLHRVAKSLFRSQRNRVDQRRNLLIFITPHIVGEADFARAAELMRQRTEPVPTVEFEAPKPPKD